MTGPTSGAKLTWTKTTLGVTFAANLVQRLHPSGWLTIARLTNEARQTWTDSEARLNTSETYRMMTEDVYGGVSQPTAPVSVTVPGTLLAVVSNEDPTVNQDLPAQFPIDVKLPEDRQLVGASGRYGRRLFRSSTRMGTELDLTSFLRRSNVAAPARGQAMWLPLINKFREDLSYVCVLTPFGDRFFMGAMVEGTKWKCNAEVDVPIQFAEVGNTPSIPVITT